MASIALGVTGSVAAYKAVYLTRLLVEAGVEVWPMMTRSATRFIGHLSLATLARRSVILDLWGPSEAGEVGHVEVAHRVDAVVIAPCSADTLQRLAQGRAGDPLTAVALATHKPVLLAPAMETGMWEHPETQRSLELLRARGMRVMAPAEGALASGRSGLGRMAEPETIFAAIMRLLSPSDLSGRKVVVTAGPTREWIDPVRFLSNPSTGKMGYAIAEVAQRRGATVELISGPVSLPAPWNVQLTRVESTEDMLEACRAALGDAQAWVMAAAPADYRPERRASHKIKKQGDTPLSLEWAANPDILSTLPRRPGQVRVGFAAESQHLVEHAREKLVRKDLDLVVANDITAADAGFGHDTNRVVLVSRDQEEALPLMSKAEVAQRLWDRIVALWP